jgi:predicted amidohydrolase
MKCDGMDDGQLKNIRVAAVQMEHSAEDKAANLEKIRSFVEAASQQGVRLIVFPECCIVGYWFLRKLSREQLVELAEPVFDGPSSRALQSMAREFQMTIGAGLIEITDDGTLYNSYVVAMPDGECKRHRKIHCFINEHVSSGDEFTVFDIPDGCRVGVLTCYDNNIVENVRITALKGAELLLAPHQTGGCNSPDPHGMSPVTPGLWENRKIDPKAIEKEFRGPKGRAWLMRWLPSRAHDNGLFLLFSNGVGVDDNEIRTGNAMILDPYGRILTETCKADDHMVIADLDASLLESSSGRRWMRTRRPALYETLTTPTGEEIDTRKSRMAKEVEKDE